MKEISRLTVPSPRFLSKAIFTLVGVMCKVWVSMNRVKSTGVDKLVNEVEKTYTLKRPMITISNHIANLDDPLIWGAILPMSIFTNPEKQRWTLGASNILFTNWLYSRFFGLGKCIKIVRGDGIYQDGMNESIDRLSEGQWLHIFPEGKVSQQTQLLYFKWGIGRLIGECFKRTGMVPVVIPIYHQGMEKSMPLLQTPIPRVGVDLNIQIGNNILCDDLIKTYLQDNNISDLNQLLGEDTNKQSINDNNDLKRKDFYKAITLHIEDQYQSTMLPILNRGRLSNPSIKSTNIDNNTKN